jgi:Zn-dependent protease with chaperone function
MAYTHPRTHGDRGGISLYLRRWTRPAVLGILALLSTGVAVHGQTPSFPNPRDLLAREPAAFVELLDVARPAPLSREDMGAILRSLPPEGEVTRLGAAAQEKVDAVRQLLTAARRDWYVIKVIDVPQAAVALHERAVVLISESAATLLSGAELQALAAHEIGHEYVWTEWHRAHQQADRKRLKELELVCDATALVMLRRLGMDPSGLIDGLEKISRFNRERFGTARNEASYPTVAERRAFARQVERWYSPHPTSAAATRIHEACTAISKGLF